MSNDFKEGDLVRQIIGCSGVPKDFVGTLVTSMGDLSLHYRNEAGIIFGSCSCDHKWEYHTAKVLSWKNRIQSNAR